MQIHMITDGGVDLPEDFFTQYGISVVPLTVHFNGEKLDQPVDLPAFYERMKNERELPQTSSPSPYDFIQQIMKRAEGEDTIILTLSSGLSSTFQHAEMAKQILSEENFSGKIEVIDSKTASIGLGILVYKAVKLANAGYSFSKVVQLIRDHVSKSKTLFFLDTLENVIKGGRLDRFRGAVASIMNIKLLMRASEEGAIEVVDKVRGTSGAMKRLIEKIGEYHIDFEGGILGIAHSNYEKKALELKNLILQKYPFPEVVIANIGPVIGTYAGEGGIVISF